MRRKIFGMVAAVMFCIYALPLLNGCGFASVDTRKDMIVTNIVKYDDEVFGKAVRACRDINLHISIVSKEGGNIMCNTDPAVWGANYNLNILLTREKDLLKIIDIKVSSAGSFLPPSESKARELIEQYFGALRRQGIQ